MQRSRLESSPHLLLYLFSFIALGVIFRLAVIGERGPIPPKRFYLSAETGRFEFKGGEAGFTNLSTAQLAELNRMRDFTNAVVAALDRQTGKQISGEEAGRIIKKAVLEANQESQPSTFWKIVSYILTVVATAAGTLFLASLTKITEKPGESLLRNIGGGLKSKFSRKSSNSDQTSAV